MLHTALLFCLFTTVQGVYCVLLLPAGVRVWVCMCETGAGYHCPEVVSLRPCFSWLNPGPHITESVWLLFKPGCRVNLLASPSATKAFKTRPEATRTASNPITLIIPKY